MNTLTDLIPSLYEGLDIVSRELVGFIPSSTINGGPQRAAVGQAVTYPVSPAGNVSDVVPAMTVPEPTDQTIGSGSITMTKARAAEFGFVGESQLGLNNNGAGASVVQADMFAQGVRSLINEIERDLAIEAAINASRAVGESGTNPFATDLSNVALAHQVLADNGAPLSDKRMVLNTTAGTGFRSLTQLTNVNQSGDTALLRQGVLGDIHGFAMTETGQPRKHTKGTEDGNYTTNTDGYSEGDTEITLITGTGTIVAGDVVQFAGDDNLYVVKEGISGPGTITIQAPGLMQDIPASATEVTVSANYNSNVGFHRGALHLATRAPALPEGGDMASDRMTMTDTRSGLSLEVAVYPGYRKVRYEVSAVWGVKLVKPEHTVLMIG